MALSTLIEIYLLKLLLIFNSPGNRPLEPRRRNLKKY